jgi:hypothetical protein
MMLERADSDRSATAIERSLSHAPRRIQVAIQRRRAQMGLPPLRLPWSVAEAREAIRRVKAAATAHRDAISRASAAVARMTLAARGHR